MGNLIKNKLPEDRDKKCYIILIQHNFIVYKNADYSIVKRK